jgi:hypothetical protein
MANNKCFLRASRASAWVYPSPGLHVGTSSQARVSPTQILVFPGILNETSSPTRLANADYAGMLLWDRVCHPFIRSSILSARLPSPSLTDARCQFLSFVHLYYIVVGGLRQSSLGVPPPNLLAAETLPRIDAPPYLLGLVLLRKPTLLILVIVPLTRFVIPAIFLFTLCSPVPLPWRGRGCMISLSSMSSSLLFHPY